MNIESPKVRLNQLREQLASLQNGSRLQDTINAIEEIRHELETREATYAKQLEDYNRATEERSVLQFNDSTLAFRRTLEANPELVEQIKASPAWLQVVVLLYGGITDEGLATYLVQYDEIATVLQLDDNMRLSWVNQLRQKEYWRESWETDDVIYSLAVHLDTEGGARRKRAKNTIPDFKPESIFSDSPLTPTLLTYLRAQKQPHLLRKELWQKWNRATDTLTQAHALMVLLLIDTDVALPVFKQILTNAQSAELADLIISHFKKRLYTLQDPLILLGANSPIGEMATALAGQLPDEQLVDVIQQFYKVYASVMHQPVQPDSLLQTKFMHQSGYINAEIWAAWLSALTGDDSVYNFAVTLDTIGKKIASLSALLNMGSAYGATFNQFATWATESVPPVLTDIDDQVGDALTVAQRSHCLPMAKIMHVGLISYMGVATADYNGLTEDVLATTLLLSTDEKEPLSDLAGAIPLTAHYELIQSILNVVPTIRNPATQSRIYWRIAQYVDFFNGINLWAAALESAERIVDPLQRSRAYERLIEYLPPKQSVRALEETEKAARQISDPVNRARALARLALFYDNDTKASLLTEALTVTQAIADVRARVDTMLLIQPLIKHNAEQRQYYDATCQRIDSAWYRHKAAGLLSVQLLAQQASLETTRQTTPVILAAFLDDLINLSAGFTQNRELWPQLLNETQRQATVVALLKEVADSNQNGLLLTPTACDVLQLLLERGELPAIYGLLPYLRTTDKSVLSFLKTWLTTAQDVELRRMAGLMLAENRQLDEQTMVCLLEILEHGAGVSLYRTSIVLHGAVVFARMPNRQYRASQLGLRLLLMIAGAYIKFTEQSPHLASILSWTWYNIDWDSSEILQACARKIREDDEQSEAAYHILAKIDLLSDQLLTEFHKLLLNNHPKIMKAVVQSWCIQASTDRKLSIPREVHEQIETILEETPDDFYDFTRVIPERLRTVGLVIEQAHEQAETIINNVYLLDDWLAEKIISLPTAVLENIHQSIMYWLDRDPNIAIEVAKDIAEEPQRIEILFNWLANTLRQSIDDTENLNKCATLLELAAAVAPLSPAAVFNLISQLQLEELITEAAMYQSRFYGRAAAVKLMAYMRQTPKTFIKTLYHACQDVAGVQQAAMQMVHELRYYAQNMIPDLIELLRDNNPSIAYSATQILTTIGRNEKTSLAYRSTILSALAEAVRQPASARAVFVYEAVSSSFYIRYLTRLDQAYYKAIMDISGVI